MISPTVKEQLHVLTTIVRHGKQDALHDSQSSRMVDNWQHAEDELRFLYAVMLREDRKSTDGE